MNTMIQKAPTKFTSLASQGNMATMWPLRLAETLHGGYRGQTPLQSVIDGSPSADPAASPVSTAPIDYSTAGQQDALEAATNIPSNATTPRVRGAPSSGTNLSPILTAAIGLAQQKEDGFAQDTMSQLSRAGALPSPTDTPEIRANKNAYMASRLAATYAQTQGGPALRAPGSPVYLGNLPNGSPGALALTGGAPAPTPKPFDLVQQPSSPGSGSSDTSVVDGLVRQARSQLAAANQPKYFTDPATGQRFMQIGRTVMRDDPKAATFPRSVAAGNKTIYEVSPGKFTDQAGNPISWGTQRAASAKPKPAYDANGFLIDPSATAPASPDGSSQPNAAPPLPAPKAKAFYNHDTVLDEIKRRGIQR